MKNLFKMLVFIKSLEQFTLFIIPALLQPLSPPSSIQAAWHLNRQCPNPLSTLTFPLIPPVGVNQMNDVVAEGA